TEVGSKYIGMFLHKRVVMLLERLECHRLGAPIRSSGIEQKWNTVRQRCFARWNKLQSLSDRRAITESQECDDQSLLFLAVLRLLVLGEESGEGISVAVIGCRADYRVEHIGTHR